MVAWHEAGHALVSELLPSVDKVQKVSIVPRGKALGYTLNLPQEDRYLKSREELIDYMKVLLAGRVSEQITFGRVTTGAADDLSRVTAIARSMVHEYGMGTSIRSHQVPGDDFTVSEALRQTRDEEVQAIAEEAYRGAADLLTDHRDLLDEIAERLLRHEVIEREEIREIMATEPRRERAADRDRRARPGHPGRGAGQRDRRASPSNLRARMFGLIDHVGVAVEDLDSALALYEGTFRDAGSLTARRSPSRASRRCCSTSATCHVELLRPLGPETPVGKFLERKGPGLHHVAYRVDDIEAVLAQLARRRAWR